MKIPLKTSLLILSLLSAGLGAAAQSADIIKQEGKTVYFDISQTQRKPVKDDPFEIVLPGQEIINPKTGKTLGREDGDKIGGTVIKAKELFAVGLLDKNIDVVGLKAEFGRKNKNADNILFLEAEFPSENAVKPLWKSDPLKEGPRFAALCDINGDNLNEAAISFHRDNEIKVYSLSRDKKLAPVFSYKIPPVKDILALDCAQLPDSGQAVLFVTLFNPLDNSFETLPLSLLEGNLEAEETFPGLTQGLAPYNRPRVLYTQQVIKAGKKYNLTKPAKLIFKDGKYSPGPELEIKGLNSVFGFNMADLNAEGILTPLYITRDGKIRARFDSPVDFTLPEYKDGFSASPNTFDFNGIKHRLYLPLPVFESGTEKNSYIAAAHNDTRGETPSAGIYILKWTGGNFAKYKVLPLQGVVYDMKQGAFGPFDNILLVTYDTPEGGFVSVYGTDNI